MRCCNGVDTVCPLWRNYGNASRGDRRRWRGYPSACGDS
jgi:hypothetical protein